MTRLVLASASPRRARLLREAGFDFEVAAVDVEERAPPGATPAEAAVAIARQKAAAAPAGDAVVLAADTLVAYGERLLGKPKDEAAARETLRLLSGRTHVVITGVALRLPGGDVRVSHVETRVTFRALGDAEIDAYVRTGEPMDKAGAYGIQGGASAFVARVEGPVDNVVGLPMDLVRRLLHECGVGL